MPKHEVTCLKCGRRFDANEGGVYYPESHRYACKDCAKKQKRKQAEDNKARKSAERKEKADERETRTGMRQSIPAMIAKIAAGVIVLMGSFPLLTQGSVIEFIVGAVIAAGLTIWGLAPYLKAKSAKRS